MYGAAYTSVMRIRPDSLAPGQTTDDYAQLVVNEIYLRAVEHNKKAHITGVLLWDGQYTFLQKLEGPKEAVEELLSKIRQDARHSAVNIIYSDDIAEREFPGWGLMVVHEDRYLNDLLPKMIRKIKKNRLRDMIPIGGGGA